MTEAINFLPYDKPNDYATPMSNALKVGQQAQAEGALSQIDVNNPGSLSAGINALVKAGAADQATTLNTLSQARAGFAQASALRQSLLDDGGLTGNSQSQGASPQMAAMAAHTHAEIANDLSAVAAIPDPQARAQAVAKLQQKYAFLGPDEVKRELGDPTDPNYTARLTGPGGLVDAHKSYAANFSALANGQTPSPVDPHADHADALRALGQDPKKLLALAAFKGIGVDTSSVEKAATEANQPFYNREAEAANAERIAYGTHTGEAEAPGETILHDAKTGVGTSFPTKAAAAQAIHDNPGKYGELTPYAKSGQEKGGSLDAENPRTTTDVQVQNGDGTSRTVPMTKAQLLDYTKTGRLPPQAAGGTPGTPSGASQAAAGERVKGYNDGVKEAQDQSTGKDPKIQNGIALAQRIRQLAKSGDQGAYNAAIQDFNKYAAPFSPNAAQRTSTAQGLDQETAGMAKLALGGIGGSIVRNMGEFQAVTKSGANLADTPQAKIYSALKLQAALNYADRYNQFVVKFDAAHPELRGNANAPAQLTAAWKSDPASRLGPLADPVWAQEKNLAGKPYLSEPRTDGQGRIYKQWDAGDGSAPIIVRVK